MDLVENSRGGKKWRRHGTTRRIYLGEVLVHVNSGTGTPSANRHALGFQTRKTSLREDRGSRGTSVSTIEGGRDTTIPFPWRSPKRSLLGTGLHDPLHGRQVCPESNTFHQGVGQTSPREGLFSCRPLTKRGQICDISAPVPIVEQLEHFLYNLSPGQNWSRKHPRPLNLHWARGREVSGEGDDAPIC